MHPKTKMVSQLQQSKGRLLSSHPQLKTETFSKLARYLFFSLHNCVCDAILRGTFFAPFVFQFQRLIFREKSPGFSFNSCLIVIIREIVDEISLPIIKAVVSNQRSKLMFLFFIRSFSFLLMLQRLFLLNRIDIDFLVVIPDFALQKETVETQPLPVVVGLKREQFHPDEYIFLFAELIVNLEEGLFSKTIDDRRPLSCFHLFFLHHLLN